MASGDSGRGGGGGEGGRGDKMWTMVVRQRTPQQFDVWGVNAGEESGRERIKA